MQSLNITNADRPLQGPRYDERTVAPMREELVRVGFIETRTASEVDAQIRNVAGTALLFVNSVCGCAAGRARPAVVLALHEARARPDRLLTVFAGNDVEATARAREYFPGYAASSPQMGLLKDGEVVFMLERRDIEGREAAEIAAELTAAFEKHCGAQWWKAAE
jgi:putative YphP/YqiW family bacilliredoxin